MFMIVRKNRIEDLQDEISKLRNLERTDDLERKRRTLEDEVTKLKEEVADLKLKKKIEDEDIKHMVKMREEQLDLQLQKKQLEFEGETQRAIAKVKDEYRDKTEKQLHTHAEKTQEIYTEIMKRLPEVKVKMSGGL